MMKSAEEPVPVVPSCCGIPMKWISLVALVFQQAGVVFLIRLSRTQDRGSKYLNTTAVFGAEVVKFALSWIFLVNETGSFQSALDLMHQHLHDSSSWLRTSAPCVLYTVQNNLLFIALSNLTGAEYQVLYQLKILSTALLSKLILGKALNGIKWFALGILTSGVAIIEWRPSEQQVHGTRFLGVAAVLAACVTSGLAGVLMEKLMKQKGVSMWVTNIQVSSVSMLISLMAVWLNDGEAVFKDGFFQGYNSLVWLVIILQAVGGLVIASVMKYADNILKCFGSALSISISCLASAIVIEEFIPTFNFIAGTCMVLLAVFFYTMPSGAAQAKLKPTEELMQQMELELENRLHLNSAAELKIGRPTAHLAT